MEKFYTTQPLLYKAEEIYGPFFTQSYMHSKRSRITGYFDVSVNVVIKYCIHKSEPSQGISSVYRFPKGMYRSEPLTPLFPFFYIFVQKQEGQQAELNEKAVLEIFTLCDHKVPKKKEVHTVVIKSPVEKIQDSSIIPQEEERRSFSDHSQERGKSPFPGRLFEKKIKKYDIPGKSQVPVFDERLPKFIPDGSLLIAKKGKIEILPKPYSAGLFLMSVDSDDKNTFNLEWTLPFNFKQHEV